MNETIESNSSQFKSLPVEGIFNDSSPEPSNIEQDQTPENKEGLDAFALNILKLIEANDPNAAIDYITEVLSNQTEAPTPEKRAILEFLIEKQRAEICKSLARTHSETLEDFESEAKSQSMQSYDQGNRLMQLSRLIDDETLANVTARSRGMGSMSFAMRGYEDVIPVIRQERAEVEEYEYSWNNIVKLQRNKLQDYAAGFKHSAEKDHLDALDSSRSVINNDDLLAEKDMTGLIDKEVIESTILGLKDIVTEARGQGLNPEQAILDSLGNVSKIDSEEFISSIESFIEVYEELINSDRISRYITELSEICLSLDKNARQALEPRLDEDLAYSINRRQSEAINDLDQITRRLSSAVNNLFDQEIGLFRASANNKPSKKHNYASAFK